MRYIHYTLEIGYCGCDDEGVIAVDDDMEHDAIDMMVNDMAQDHASGWEGDSRLGWDDEWDVDSEEYEEYTSLFYENVSGSWHWATAEEMKDYGVSES